MCSPFLFEVKSDQTSSVLDQVEFSKSCLLSKCHNNQRKNMSDLLLMSYRSTFLSYPSKLVGVCLPALPNSDIFTCFSLEYGKNFRLNG